MSEFEDLVKEIEEPQKLFLTLRADDTDKNATIHDSFRVFADEEFPRCRDNYTLALGKLLEYFKHDSKTEMLWDEIEMLKERIRLLETQEQKDNGTF